MDSAVTQKLRCPSCKERLAVPFRCGRCGEFLCAQGQPVLVDFENSILDRDVVAATSAASPVKRGWSPLRRWLEDRTSNANSAAERVARAMAEAVGPEGRVLVIGGGVIGAGAATLYERTRVVGTDIYPTVHTQFVVDGHNLPFIDESFDGVWIQAVLEHVLDPETVAAEIHRVLRPNGLVFADTPFMQHVHEGAYDFTRFTLSGHRWLFRRFEVIETGATAGAGTMLVWSLRHFTRAVTGSNKLAWLVGLLWSWLRFFDGSGQRHEDAASGCYFYGRKATTSLAPREMVDFYRSRSAPASGA